jgi:hypothetical protein
VPIDFASLVVNGEYDRPALARLWGYESFHAIGRGVVTPAGQNLIALFITRDHQPALPQYDNHFDGELLWMDGETGHGTDRRLADSRAQDEVHLLYREQDHMPFRYCGEVALVEAFLSENARPSRFIFTARPRLITEAEIARDELTSISADDVVPQPEGQSHLRTHVVYERSRKNRQEALRIHGHRCHVCGFDFDSTYGADLADAYIEIHHVQSITEIDGRVVDPRTDLRPLCSNCHRMAHRRRGAIIPIEDLQRRVRELRAQ